jgi:hypothetical protein
VESQTPQPPSDGRRARTSPPSPHRTVPASPKRSKEGSNDTKTTETVNPASGQIQSRSSD